VIGEQKGHDGPMK